MRTVFFKYRLKQAGVSLFVVLIGILALSLAALGIIRSVDTSTLVAGNLGYKNATTAAADQATESAITWLQNNSGNLEQDGNSIYYSNYFYSNGSENSNLDITGKSTDVNRIAIDWNHDGCDSSVPFSICIIPSIAAATTLNGYSTSFLITRMCNESGNPNLEETNGATIACSRPYSEDDTNKKCGSIDYNSPYCLKTPSSPYYRIVVRATGPKNSVSYTETYLYF